MGLDVEKMLTLGLDKVKMLAIGLDGVRCGKDVNIRFR
jgi:hypothetical protein